MKTINEMAAITYKSSIQNLIFMQIFSSHDYNL